MARQPVVSLAGKKPERPTEHFVRLSRGESGAGFIVGYVDHTGVEDFRSQSEHRTYDEALKEAERRAYHVRRPLRDDTGVEAIEPQTKPADSSTKQISAAAPKRPEVTSAEPEKQLDELPRLAESFNLPELTERFESVDLATALKRSDLRHRVARTAYLEEHAKLFANSRDHVVSYTQKTHDQIQGQISALYVDAIAQQAVLYGYLEAAFERIEQLERAPRGLNYRGIYHQGDTYEEQDACTWGGSIWVAKETTNLKPGDDGAPWVLACKKGRDGKDLRNAA